MASKAKKNTLELIIVSATDDDTIEQLEAALADFDLTLRVAVSADSYANDDESGDEDEDATYTEEELAEMGSDELKSILEAWELEIEGRFSTKKAIAAILEEQGGDEDEEDEDEEEEEEGEDLEAMGAAADDDDADAIERLTELAEEAELDVNEYPTWAELAEAVAGEEEEEGDEDEDEDEEGEEELDEEAMLAMSVAELSAVYKEVVGKAPPKGMKRDAKIEAIFEAAGE